jgi:hypothetical protein
MPVKQGRICEVAVVDNRHLIFLSNLMQHQFDSAGAFYKPA